VTMRLAHLALRSDEPAYVSFKCLDPDGYTVEGYWEPAQRGVT
jgi:hypothetical protein